MDLDSGKKNCDPLINISRLNIGDCFNIDTGVQQLQQHALPY
jgi:hypothetical protein